MMLLMMQAMAAQISTAEAGAAAAPEDGASRSRICAARDEVDVGCSNASAATAARPSKKRAGPSLLNATPPLARPKALGTSVLQTANVCGAGSEFAGFASGAGKRLRQLLQALRHDLTAPL